METKHTPVYGIKGKLISAVCMLLVAIIMVVSSTYAWFTLSTAPEITGITTTVGANGALEMLLATKQNGTWVYNEGVLTSNDWTTKNTYWGNLVDVSDNTVYGINDLKLYPATLNATDGVLSSASFLKIPSYGPDGRVSELMPNTVTGTYDIAKENFYENDGFGIRAIGVASGMTDRQYAYRNLLAAAQTDMATAKNLASQSLNDNGDTLANVAIKKASNANAAYNAADVASVQSIVDDLLAVNGVLAKIESSYLNYVYAFAASNLVTGDNDLAYMAVQNYFGGDIDKLYAIVAPVEEGDTSGRVQGQFAITLGDASATSITVTLPSALYAPLNALKATREKVEEADAMLEVLATATADGGTVAWSTGATYEEATIGIGNALNLLADTDEMTINNIPAREVKDRISELVNTVSSGITVKMASGGGVYADIADHCGDYTVSIVIEEITYAGITLNNQNATMKTASAVLPAYLSVINSAVADKAPASQGAEGGMPLTEFYGYVVDLAFKTNASNSNLLLEINGADRIYEDNMPGTETQGGGSRMTFTRAETATDLTDDQIKSLMSATRIVFFDTNTLSVYANARLDVEHAVTTAGGIVADINIVKEFDGVKIGETLFGVDSDGNIIRIGANQLPTLNDVAYWRVEEEGVVKYYGTKTEGEEDTYADELTETPVATHVTVYLTEQNSVIRALTANEAAHVSALVYLDGDLITNEDVTAIGETSVTMKMNLQFRSDATLVPMTDGNLHQPLEPESDTTETGTQP